MDFAVCREVICLSLIHILLQPVFVLSPKALVSERSADKFSDFKALHRFSVENLRTKAERKDLHVIIGMRNCRKAVRKRRKVDVYKRQMRSIIASEIGLRSSESGLMRSYHSSVLYWVQKMVAPRSLRISTISSRL